MLSFSPAFVAVEKSNIDPYYGDGITYTRGQAGAALEVARD